MKQILFLVHRIPYPPNKGDKIRSYHILKYLSNKYRVHLAAFIDNSEDWQYVDHVKKLCENTHFFKLNSSTAKMRSLFGLMTNDALTLFYYRDNKLKIWINHLLKTHEISTVLVFSSAMAQYIRGLQCKTSRRVIDFVDIDSDKWMQYSESLGWPWNWIYKREGNKLSKEELRIAEEFDASILVSEKETDILKKRAPKVKDKIFTIRNGVNTSFFNPYHKFDNPYGVNKKVLLFTGAMDYWANVDAVSWFVKEIFPLIRGKVPESYFYIVGRKPTKTVKDLSKLSGVYVTGSVNDVRPYIAYADIVVAPLRIACGIQNKVLEAMAMNKPILATSKAFEGIEGCKQIEEWVSDNPNQIATNAILWLQQRSNFDLGIKARQCVIRNYDWGKCLKRLENILL
jgi:sugar transferase (PEP-CTERM/EpsH1 system associated)